MALLTTVLFDLDGVLVDSHRLHYQSWQSLADDLGLRFSEMLGDTFRGMDRHECVRVLFEEFNHRPAPGKDRVHELTEVKNALYQKLLAKATPEDLVLPGATGLLGACRSHGIQIVVASGSKNAKQVLDRAALTSMVDIVIDRFDVAITKPDPSIFIVALDRAKAKAVNAVGIEDATLGVRALHRAGVKAIGVGHHVEGADLHLDSVREVTVDAMRALVASA